MAADSRKRKNDDLLPVWVGNPPRPLAAAESIAVWLADFLRMVTWGARRILRWIRR